MSKKHIILAVCAIVGFSTRAQNLLLNGGFESPTIPSDTAQNATPSSWAWGSNVGLIFNGNVGGIWSWPPPQEGQQFVDIGNESFYTLSQAFTVTNQGVYMLSWYDSSGHAGGLTTSPYSMIVSTGGVQTLTSNRFDAYHATIGVWQARTQQLALIPGSYTLRFRAEGVFNGLDSLIDNVSLQLMPDSDLLASIHCSAVDICWPGRTNQLYQVQYRWNPSDTNWIDFGPPVMGTGTNCVTDGINGTEHKFYRVIRVP